MAGISMLFHSDDWSSKWLQTFSDQSLHSYKSRCGALTSLAYFVRSLTLLLALDASFDIGGNFL